MQIESANPKAAVSQYVWDISVSKCFFFKTTISLRQMNLIKEGTDGYLNPPNMCEVERQRRGTSEK